MFQSRALFTAAATAVLAGGTLLTGPASASATASEAGASVAAPSGCTATYYCVYQNAGYRGAVYKFQDDNPSWARWDIFNQDSSSFNNGTSGLSVALYGEENYGRKLGCLPRGQGWTQHRPNDDGESNKWGC
ncbi:peptidase inhibitor family I36 protein [Streptomyces sp. NPDC057702]|uniref:peptidase inhibitor family I36 protein n=1 Tax=unclassified Streptomyces TaxID=2593676 RepID=UPI0036973228